jgi:tRNA 2-thiouridine synthesizing protein A
MTRAVVDARRLLCPLPVIRTQERAAELNPGDTIEVLCTDRGCLHDIPAWCRMHGHDCAVTKNDGREFVFQVVIGGK